MTNEEAKGKMRETLLMAFSDILRPERIRTLRITQVEKGVVHGFLLTHCPVENRDHWKDFEAHLIGGNEGPIKYAIVDGKRFSPHSSGSPPKVKSPVRVAS